MGQHLQPESCACARPCISVRQVVSACSCTPSCGPHGVADLHLAPAVGPCCLSGDTVGQDGAPLDNVLHHRPPRQLVFAENAYRIPPAESPKTQKFGPGFPCLSAEDSERIAMPAALREGSCSQHCISPRLYYEDDLTHSGGAAQLRRADVSPCLHRRYLVRSSTSEHADFEYDADMKSTFSKISVAMLYCSQRHHASEEVSQSARSDQCDSRRARRRR